ncbi:MAG TPA: hypothetical protein VJT31_09250 [Rugosimonospora sp.]|nr:hypothetical protein [Rugosimonospora sp.]
MVTTAELIVRGTELKRELVAYAQQPRYHRAFREALRAQGVGFAVDDDREQIMFLDYFVLQHRFRNGKTVVEQFVAARPDLSAAEREMVLGWRDVVEGIFEVRGRDGDALLVHNLVDELPYRVHANTGPGTFDRIPDGSFLITRLIPVGPEWVMSGASATVPHSQRQQIYKRAADLAQRRPSLARRNPDKRAGDPAEPAES